MYKNKFIKMREKYYFFDFNEANFDSIKSKLRDCIDSFSKDANLQCLSEFPPCIFDKKKRIKLVEKEIIFSDNDFLLNHNLFFGKDYIMINKRFKDSPFISDNCKSCEHFKSYYCRGIFNKKFLDIKQEIIKNRGLRQYNSLMTDYSYGFFGVNSNCNHNCYFCFYRGGTCIDKPRPFVFINPPLSIKEAIHFLHYLPYTGIICTMFLLRCASGEILMHKDNRAMLKLAAHFILNKTEVGTNGYLLNDKLLDFISDLGYGISLSVNSVNNSIRKKMMGYKNDFDIKKLIKNILEKNIKLNTSLVVLKENILNGDLKETISFLSNHGLKPLIIPNVCWMDWDKEKLENMDYGDDFLISYLDREGLHDFVNLTADESKVILSKFLSSFLKFAHKFDKKEQILILSPRPSYKLIKDSLKGLNNIHVEGLDSALGGNRTISSSLTIDVFLDSLSKIDYDYNLLIIPKDSFNIFMNDIKDVNINTLLSKISKKVILVS